MKKLSNLTLTVGTLSLAALILTATSTAQAQMMMRDDAMMKKDDSSMMMTNNNPKDQVKTIESNDPNSSTAMKSDSMMMNDSGAMMNNSMMAKDSVKTIKSTNPNPSSTMNPDMMDDMNNMPMMSDESAMNMMNMNDKNMMNHGQYMTYSPARVWHALRDDKKVMMVFLSNNSEGTMLNASLQDHEMWLPKDTVVIYVNYDTNNVIKRKYAVSTPNTILVITKQGMKQKISGRTTSKVSDINGFMNWMENYYNMDKEMISMVGGAQMFSTKDIVTNVMNASNLTTLVTAVKAAGLVETLQGPGPFTVFGPDNAAFAKLPAGTVEMLVMPENKAMLANILTYHVVAGTYTSSDLTDGKVLTTVQGQKLTVKRTGNKVMLMSDTDGNVATVITADVMQSNGVAHVIDTVLMPMMK